eukprot:GSChrysophyteH2.ASY1.ANO1.800.1 assembled CDS
MYASLSLSLSLSLSPRLFRPSHLPPLLLITYYNFSSRYKLTQSDLVEHQNNPFMVQAIGLLQVSLVCCSACACVFLPGNAKIAKDAKESIQSCVSEFISFITSEASDKCQLEKRKTINGDDLLWAMGTLGFDQYGEPLRVYLSKCVIVVV